jgi:hypothetical protein
MRKERTELPRLHVGQTVRVTDTIMTQRSMQIGEILSVQTSPMAETLDKYVVLFRDDARLTFWDIQLDPLFGPTRRDLMEERKLTPNRETTPEPSPDLPD